MGNAIDSAGLDHWYGRGPLARQVLFGVDLQVRSGEIVLLSGPSGCGKTTLLTLVGGLRRAARGNLCVLGEQLVGASADRLVRLRRRIGFIFQAHNLLGFLSAVQNVEMAVALRTSHRAERTAGAVALLEAVGLGDHLGAYPDALSGGQKQRVAVARALAAGPQLVLADEPTASLDRASGRAVVELLQGLARERGVAVLMVTHDSRILDIADRVVAMEDGRITGE